MLPLKSPRPDARDDARSARERLEELGAPITCPHCGGFLSTGLPISSGNGKPEARVASGGRRIGG